MSVSSPASNSGRGRASPHPHRRPPRSGSRRCGCHRQSVPDWNPSDPRYAGQSRTGRVRVPVRVDEQLVSRARAGDGIRQRTNLSRDLAEQVKLLGGLARAGDDGHAAGRRAGKLRADLFQGGGPAGSNVDRLPVCRGPPDDRLEACPTFPTITSVRRPRARSICNSAGRCRTSTWR